MPSPLLSAECASRLCEDLWNNPSTESEADLAAQPAEQLPPAAHAYAAAPKPLLRPLIPAAAGTLESAFVLENTDGLREKHSLHTSDASRMYRAHAGPTARQYSGPASPSLDYADWAPDQPQAPHPRTALVSAASKPTTSARRIAAAAPLLVMPHHVYDILPYQVTEPPAPSPSGSAAADMSIGHGAGGPVFLQHTHPHPHQQHHQQLQPAVALVGASVRQPQHTSVTGPRRPQYGQRVLLQRLVPPPDGDVSYLQGLPYVDTYAAVEQRRDAAAATSGGEHRAGASQHGHPQPLRRHPHSHHHHHHHPYGTYQDAVQRGPYIVHRATASQGAAAYAARDVHSERATVLAAAVAAARGGAAAAEFAGALVRRGDEGYEWASSCGGVATEAEDETEAGSETRGAHPHLAVVKYDTAAAAAPLARAEVKSEDAERSAGGRRGGGAAAGDGAAVGGGGGELWNLEALAEVACRAAELLERDVYDTAGAAAQAPPPSASAAADATARGSMSVDSGGNSCRTREAAPAERSGGVRRRIPSAATAPGPPPPAEAPRQTQQQHGQQHQQPAAAAAAAATAPGSATAASQLPLTILHDNCKCPKVLAPRSGRLGDVKHLVLPAEIAAALPHDVCYGGKPIWVQALMAPADKDATGADPNQPAWQRQQQQSLWEQCELECVIGNGPGGFPALHLPVQQAVYGRPVRRFTLRKDLVLELELGEAVVKPTRTGPGKRAAAAAVVAVAAAATAPEARREEMEEEEEGEFADGDAEAAAVDAAAVATGSPAEDCSSPRGSGKRRRSWGAAEKEREGVVVGSGEDAQKPCYTPNVVEAETVAGTANGTAPGTGSGSNVSDDTRVVAGAVASPPAATATAPPPPPAAAAGGGGRRRGGAAAAVTLPIIARRPSSGKPTVMRSCTGAIGSKKHLPLPTNIVKALPHPQRSGAAPVDVVIVYHHRTAPESASDVAAPAPAPAPAATSRGEPEEGEGEGKPVAEAVTQQQQQQQVQPPQEERLSCFVGPTGSHGCTALQVQVGRHMNGRRLLHIILKTDLTIELGLGEVVEVPPAAPPGRRRGGAAAAVTSTQPSVEDDGDDDDAADGAASVRRRGSGGGLPPAADAAVATTAAADADDGAAPPPPKRRRSSSISPCDSTALVVAAAAAAAAAPALPLPPPPHPLALRVLTAAATAAQHHHHHRHQQRQRQPGHDEEGTRSDSSGSGGHAGVGVGVSVGGEVGQAMDANLRRGFEQFVALAAQAGYVVGRITQRHPPPAAAAPQRSPSLSQREAATAAAVAAPPPMQRAPPSRFGGPVHARPPPPPHYPAAYGMLPYAQAVAAGYTAVEAAAAAAPPPVRRAVPPPPLRGRPVLDPYGRPVHLPYHHAAPPPLTLAAEDADVSSSVGGDGGGAAAAAAAAAARPAAGGGSASGVTHLTERPEEVAAAAALGRAWGLLQQLPRAQTAATRALALASNSAAQGASASASAGAEASATLGNFRACLAGILGLLMRAREAATDLAGQLDAAAAATGGGGGAREAAAAAAETLRSDLLVAAPAMLNAAECLLEWYNLLAAASDERTAVSYAGELAGSAALVKAQLADALAPLAVVVRA